jgi:glycosyltransferase involved in cell wall biosynthesis
MGMGLPVLHGVAGESADIVRDEGAGIPFEPENVDELCAALSRLKSNPAELDAFKASCLKGALNYDRTNLALRLMRILEDVAAKKPPNAA